MSRSDPTVAGRTEADAREGRTRPFDQSLPMMLMRAREVVMQRFRPHLRSHDLTDQQWRILRALAEEEQMELLALSQRCMVRPPSLSRTVPALTARGLVRREDHPSDRRRALISLTEDGMELFREMSAESARIYKQLALDIGEETLSDTYKMLADLIELVQRSDTGDVTPSLGDDE
jgi:homoprotocatechuate degradation regulator HpaR